MSSTPPSDSAERVRSLLTLYRASRYDACLPDGRRAVLEVGCAPDPALRPWLGDAPLAAYLTACNPRSSALPAAQNARLLAQLRRELDAAGLRYLGVEIDPEHYATARERLLRETAQGLLMPNMKSSV